MRMSVGRKIGLGFGAVFFVMAMYGVLSIVLISKIHRDIRTMIDVEAPTLEAANEMEINLIGTGFGLLGYLNDRDTKHLERIKDDAVDFKVALNTYRDLSHDDEKPLIIEISKPYEEFTTIANKLIKLEDKQDAAMGQLFKYYDAMDYLLDEQIQKNITDGSVDAFEKLEAAMEIEININGIAKGLGEYLRTHDIKYYNERILKDESDFRIYYEKYNNLQLSEKEKQWIRSLKSTFEESMVLTKEVVFINQDMTKKIERFVALRRQMDSILDDKIQPLTTKHHHDLDNNIVKIAMVSLFSSIGLLVAGGLAGLIASVWIFRNITRAVNELSKATDAMARGNLNAQAKIMSDDELGDLAKSFNRMTTDLRTTIATKEALEKEITERKKAEEKVVALSKFPSENPNPVIRIGADGKVMFANKAAGNVLKSWQSEVGKQAPETWKQLTLEALKTGKHKLYEQNIESRVFSFGISPVHEEGYVNLYARDITELKKAEEEVQRLAKFPSENPNPVFRISKEGKLLYSNDAARKVLAGWGTNINKEVPDRWKQFIDQAFAEEKGIVEQEDIEGKTFSFAISTVKAAGYANVYARDITERKKAEEELREYREHLERLVKERTKKLEESQAQLFESEKLASIGELGSGVAHELNSPLQGIITLLGVYKSQRTPDSEEYTNINDILEACEYMRMIIKNLNEFSAKSTGKIEELNCNEIIEGTLVFSSYVFKKKQISIEKDFAEGLKLVSAEKNKIQQIIINMITNAGDAMSVGGAFLIKTRNIKEEEKSFVEMTFTDNGGGIEENNISKLFDPFYTTKRPGRGIGLGLSIVFNIIKGYNGNIKVESKINKGTTFCVRLPAS